MSDKKFLFEAIDAQRAELCSMADQIFDNPEYEGEEVFASGLLTDYLKKNGFEVEMAVLRPRSALSTVMARVDRFLVFFASTTRSATWDTAAAIICRARDVWAPQ